MAHATINIGTIIWWKELVRRTKAYVQVWQCISCWKETTWSRSKETWCQWCIPNHNRLYYIWQIINDRMVVKKKSLYSSILDMKCIYCWLIKEIKPSHGTKCKCRKRKDKFNNICNEYSYISDCVPAQSPSKSFKINLQAVTAYMKANHIPDMKISELSNNI